MTRPARRSLVPMAVALGGVAVVAAVHLGPVRLALEDRLAGGAEAELAAVGLDGLAVAVTGLDARLVGDVPRQADVDLAVSAVGRVPALAGVDASEITVRPPSGTEPTAEPTVESTVEPAAEPTVEPTAGPATEPTAPSGEPVAVVQAREALAAVPLITFEPNSAVLTGDGRASVVIAAGIVTAAGPEVRFRIEAHTDTAGPPEANKVLSLRRATAVRAALLQLGVARTRVQAVGLGETRPLVNPEVTDEDRAANRRVEIVAEAVPAP